MKAIARFLVVLLLVCGTALAWKSNDHKFHHYSSTDEGQKEEGEILQAVLEPVRSHLKPSGEESTWSKPDFQAKLEDAFQKNDPCAVLDLLHHTKDAAPRDYWSAGMAVLLGPARDKDPLLEELLASSDSPLYGQPHEGATRIETRFFNALIYSGQMRGLDEGDESGHHRAFRAYDKAIDVLKTLAQEDPDNGAYSYFLGASLKQMGGNKEEVHAAFSQSAKAPHFDSFAASIYDRLEARAYNNVAEFAFVHSFLESAPSPDYEGGIRYLKFWAHNEEPGKWIAYKLSKRLTELGTEYKTRSPGYQYSRSEYILGQNLKYTVEGTMEKSWEDYMSKMRAAQDFISEMPRPVRESETNLYRERIAPKPTCGPDAWRALFAAYKAKKE